LTHISEKKTRLVIIRSPDTDCGFRPESPWWRSALSQCSRL